MIFVLNFREYLIAMGAVFLALALGILIGVSFSDSVLVAGQRDIIELMEGRLAGLEELARGQEKELRRWEAVKPLLLRGVREAMEGKRILLLSYEAAPAEDIRALLEEKGAEVSVVLVPGPPLPGGAGPGGIFINAQELAGLLSAPGEITAPELAALGLQLQEGASGAGAGAAMESEVAAAAGAEPAALLQTPPDCCLIQPGFRAGFLHELWRWLHESGIRVIALYPWQEKGGAPRPPKMRPEVSLVDNIDTFWGQTALLRLLAGGARGHYGFGGGSRGLIPEADEND